MTVTKATQHGGPHTHQGDSPTPLCPFPQLPVPISALYPHPSLSSPNPKLTSSLNNLGQCADLCQNPVGTVQIATEPEPLQEGKVGSQAAGRAEVARIHVHSLVTCSPLSPDCPEYSLPAHTAI